MFRFAWPLMGSLMLNYLVTNMVPLIVNAGSSDRRSYRSSSPRTAGGSSSSRCRSRSRPPCSRTSPGCTGRSGTSRCARGRGRRCATRRCCSCRAWSRSSPTDSPFLNVFANHLYAKPGALPLAILVVSAIPLALSQIIQSSINAIGRRRLELYITTTQVAVLLGAVVVLMAALEVPVPGSSSSGSSGERSPCSSRASPRSP